MHLLEARNMDDVRQAGEDSLGSWEDLMLPREKVVGGENPRSLRGSSETEGIKMRSGKQETRSMVNCIAVSNYLLSILWENDTFPPLAM